MGRDFTLLLLSADLNHFTFLSSPVATILCYGKQKLYEMYIWKSRHVCMYTYSASTSSLNHTDQSFPMKKNLLQLHKYN